MVISCPTPDIAQPIPAQHWRSLGASGNLDAPEVDCETAALFRASLRPLISKSVSWPGLMDALRVKGFGLAFRGGRLFLTNHTTGSRICSLRFLGMPLAELVAQLGRPIVRALPGQRADGELLREPPTAPAR
jgi:hypothetical protein